MSPDRAVLRKRDLVDRLSKDFTDIRRDDMGLVVEIAFDAIMGALSAGDRVEIRGIGSFQVHESGPDAFRNPKSGAVFPCRKRKRITFKPGRSLRSL